MNFLVTLRVLCVLLATIGLEITVTPPQPPPLKDEEAPSTSLEVLVKQRCGPALIKRICWFAAFAEIITIIAAVIAPSSTIAGEVLNVLDGKKRVDYIHASPMCIIGAMLAVVGGMTRRACYRELGSLFTFEMSIRRDHRLITTGPYSLARHPGYTGVISTVSGIVMLHIAPGSWVRECGALSTKIGWAIVTIYTVLTTIISIGLLKRMKKEDEALRDTFQEQWDEWAERVPWRLIPGIY